MPEQSLGMRGTSSYTAERPGDFGQKIKDLARRKRARVNKSSSSGRGFEEPGQPRDIPAPNLLTFETL